MLSSVICFVYFGYGSGDSYMQCCGAQLFLPEHSFIFFSAAPFPFLEPVHSLGSAFPALPEAGFRRFSFASLFLLRFLAILPGRTCCGRRRCFARLLPGLRSTALPRTQCHGRSGGIPSLAAAMPPTVASLTPPRCSYLVHTGTCCGLAGGRSGLFRSANAAAPCFPRLFRDRFLSKSPHRFSLQS